MSEPLTALPLPAVSDLDDAALKVLFQQRLFYVPLTIQQQIALFFLVDEILKDIQAGEAEPDAANLEPVFKAIQTQFVLTFHGVGIQTPAPAHLH